MTPEEKITDLKANFDHVLEGKDLKIKTLGERCNQLLKDKGDLTDKVKSLEEYKNGNFVQTVNQIIEGRNIKIKELEQQIEKMKRHCNCKHRDSEGYCEVKRTYLMDLSYDGCDKWELED
jgi:hypothetical protein